MGQIFFLILAAVAVVSAFGVVFNKNVVHSALFLLANFCVLAIFYFSLNAQFLAVVQILVYAGAIVVLFLFVVMLLGAELGEQMSSWLTVRNAFLAALGLILLTVIGTAVFENNYVFQTAGKTGNLTQEIVQQYGQTQVISRALFTDYLLAFELVSVLLLVGIVGVVWLARQAPESGLKKDEQ
ncbi:MAG: NADH-quinone oxidoreductase subunit J [Anaerolineae bacterium]|nr:NADH-quinone oxidoreductase subunit J [Anaerolineae bacterium]